MLGDSGAWYGLGGPITIVSMVSGALDWARTWVDDGGGTVAGSAVDVEMSADEAGTDVGGSFSSSYVIIQGWGIKCISTRVVNISEHINVPSLSQ